LRGAAQAKAEEPDSAETNSCFAIRISVRARVSRVHVPSKPAVRISAQTTDARGGTSDKLQRSDMTRLTLESDAQMLVVR